MPSSPTGGFCNPACKHLPTTDQTISGYTVTALNASNGRGTLFNGSDTLAFYVIAPNQFLFIDITPVPSNGPSALFFADPH